jgi:hypothetical protein
MGKSMMAIHRQIEKDKYRASPLGKLERRLSQIYTELQDKKIMPTLAVAEKIKKIRNDNEKTQMDYIEGYKVKMQKLNDEHRQFVDDSLMKAFKEEIALLEEFLK